MADALHIKQFEVADRDALLAFLRTAYPDEPRKSELAFWTWHYVENPNTSPDGIPLWIVKSGDRIVAQLATIPVELNVGEERVPAIWILDLVVEPEFRRRGLMKRLVLEAEKHYPFMLGLSTNAQ